MRTVAIVQARMTSTRLPGKVLADLHGAPMLARQLARLRRARTLDEIVLATTTNASDGPVVDLACRLGIRVHRGPEHDVLQRYLGAARMAEADAVVRITADCPLNDGAVVDSVVCALGSEFDYASNVLPRSFPRGLDAEAFTRSALERCGELATSTPAREHVTWFMYRERPDLFKQRSVTADVDGADLRWTVDTPEDLSVVRAIYSGLDLADRHVEYPEILAWVRAHPEISAMNAGVEQKQS